MELRFPSFQDLTPLQHPPGTKKVPKRPIAKLLDWFEIYETRFCGFEEIISQKFAEIEVASKICPAVEPEIETESWWERAEEVDGQNYNHGWVESIAKGSTLVLRHTAFLKQESCRFAWTQMPRCFRAE